MGFFVPEARELVGVAKLGGLGATSGLGGLTPHALVARTSRCPEADRCRRGSAPLRNSAGGVGPVCWGPCKAE